MPTLPTLNYADIYALFGVVITGVVVMWVVSKSILLFKSH